MDRPGIRCPRVGSLLKAFPHLERKQALLIRRLAKARPYPHKLRVLIDKECPKTASYAHSCWNDPFDTKMWRTTLVLDAIDTILGTCGVESIGPASAYQYCNAGDTYATTIIYTQATDTLRIGCWGDVVEAYERRHGYGSIDRKGD